MGGGQRSSLLPRRTVAVPRLIGNTIHIKNFSNTACRLDKLHGCNSAPGSQRGQLGRSISGANGPPAVCGCPLREVPSRRERILRSAGHGEPVMAS